MATRNQGRWRRLNIQFLVPLILAAAFIFIGWSRLCLAAADGPSDARALVREHVERASLRRPATRGPSRQSERKRCLAEYGRRRAGQLRRAFGRIQHRFLDRRRPQPRCGAADMTGRRNGQGCARRKPGRLSILDRPHHQHDRADYLG